MSQKDDSESDIWEYKPLEKKRKTKESQSVTKRRCTFKKTSKKDTSLSVKSKEKSEKAESGDWANSKLETASSSFKLSPATEAIPSGNNAAERSSSEDYCPICQMPFFILVVQSQRWHVAECLDTPRDKCQECPDGLQCSSTIPNHYKKFNHTLLAHGRANSSTAVLSLSQQAETRSDASFGSLPGLTDSDVNSCSLDASQGKALSLSPLSSQSASPENNNTPSKPANSLLLLRSPAPDDLKKKKGWLSSNRGQKSTVASQGKTEISSTPVKEITTSQACEILPKDETSLEIDDRISYSPLSELPAETEASNECRKALFNNDKSDEESMMLFNDSFSSEDEILADFIDNLEDGEMALEEPSSSSTQVGSVSSLAPANQASTDATSRAEPGSTFQSPQSLVLEHLREALFSSEGQRSQNSSDTIQSETLCTADQVPSFQDFSGKRSQNMPPHKGHSRVGQASGLKQTDIGVFFGLRPLKEEKNETESGADEPGASSVPTTGGNSKQKRQRRDRQLKSTAADLSQSTETGNDLSSRSAREDSGRGGRRGWRTRWTRGGPGGEGQLPRCPFYKKIPGTKFVVDAFRYGEIEGIAAYFLTHFHSDHYGGLTKSSTFPIYCNKITGNLVRSKLRVAEQYVHVLPMNTEVSVEGVRVILLDANHCPGAAMLLFFLPDGQTVLHTGDFRADPSMEAYPELVSCRVQTLYLDTTYCSPEYTFPTQQEVISFAASTAFELVTLNPRTLVVCGSYSVGKEKVFLALAEALGSKVCLSRDKYNTMCCLESEQIRNRITTDWKAAQVHVLPMMQLSFKKLQDHLARFASLYDQLVAFKPTGWTFSEQVEAVGAVQPQISGNISVYGIPYSEHSSFLELKRFVQWLRPLKIIPTVNVGSWSSRKAMESCFREWTTESKAKL
ncbi:DNA cross-link repair 1A protein [Kryptolebias marmoratus]|uniref:DNA cross-link repair 1A protein n=1 Tax=Kryptolebias marmoratus TaxID=37003 RepID=A0A3Q3GP44_KRYMA|nr:DNA cross-link repair 1A protein [Kryptolebias marmoratus]